MNKKELISIYGGKVTDWKRHKNADGSKGGWVHRDAKIHNNIYVGELAVFLGGVFRGGVFHGGVFRGGVFHGGVFRGGVFHGGVFYVTPPIATRHDGYVFTAKIVEGEMRIWAGCRNFSLAEALDHWGAGHRFSEESLAIVKFLETQARLPIHNQGVPE